MRSRKVPYPYYRPPYLIYPAGYQMVPDPSTRHNRESSTLRRRESTADSTHYKESMMDESYSTKPKKKLPSWSDLKSSPKKGKISEKLKNAQVLDQLKDLEVIEQLESQLLTRPFQRNLSQLIGRNVVVGTPGQTYEGKLADVQSDHILLQREGNMYIRTNQIVYVKPK